MMDTARFAYAQARLQARHGKRPDDNVWQRLNSIGDLANYLQVAQKTALRSWSLSLQANQSSHDIELSLRNQFRDYVDDVAHWYPQHWSTSILWVKRLPDLPALQYLLSGNAVLHWMLDDPDLQSFALDNVAQRIETIQNSDCAPLLNAWRRGQPLYLAWAGHWQSLWPKESHFTSSLKSLSNLLTRTLHEQQAESTASSQHQRALLKQNLNAAFRRYSFEPAAAYAHLALTALDLEKLRGDVVRRALFSEKLVTSE